MGNAPGLRRQWPLLSSVFCHPLIHKASLPAEHRDPGDDLVLGAMRNELSTSMGSGAVLLYITVRENMLKAVP